MYTIDFDVLGKVSTENKDLVTNMIYQFLNADTTTNGAQASFNIGYQTAVATLVKYEILVKTETKA